MRPLFPAASSLRSPALFPRVLLMAIGTGFGAYGYLLTVAADLGNGPLFAVQDGLSRGLGMSLATSATVVGLGMVGVAIALRAPLGVGTVLMPLANGWWIALLEPYVPAVDGTVLRWVQFVAGTAVMMCGAVLAVATAFGASAMDGVMLGLTRRLGLTPARTRLGMEVSLAVTGAALGGSVGAGTVVMGAIVGHLYQFWSVVLQRAGLARVGLAVGGVSGAPTAVAPDRLSVMARMQPARSGR